MCNIHRKCLIDLEASKRCSYVRLLKHLEKEAFITASLKRMLRSDYKILSDWTAKEINYIFSILLECDVKKVSSNVNSINELILLSIDELLVILKTFDISDSFQTRLYDFILTIKQYID